MTSMEKKPMSVEGPHLLIFNVAAEAIQDSYEAHESIADWLGGPIEQVHQGLAAGRVSSLLDGETRPTLAAVLANITYAESAELRKLWELVEAGCRIYVLVNVEDSCFHELLMAFYGLLVVHSRCLPNILCMQIEQDCVPRFQVTLEVDMSSVQGLLDETIQAVLDRREQ
jgi:hypothetical protein